MNAATQLLLRQLGEPTLHQIEPRCAGGREVEMEAGMPRQPALDRRGLVRGVVVEDDVDIEGPRHLVIDADQELAELDGTMS